jgi:hypothetical protein
MGMFADLAAEWDDIQNPFYPIAPDILFQAAVTAGGRLKWTVQQADGTSRTITFVASKDHIFFEDSMITQGLFTVFIVPEELEGVAGARLRSAGKANDPNAFGGGVTTAFGAAVNGALIQMGYLKDGEFTNLGAPAPNSKPAPTTGKNPFADDDPKVNGATGATSSASGLAGELAALTALHKSGALTDAEFSAAKKKLIG